MVLYRARGVMRNGRRLGLSTTPKPNAPPPTPQGTINTTDMDARLVKGMRCWLQGYNARPASNEQQIVIAAEVTVASPDFGHLEPMLNAARSELQLAAVDEISAVMLADAGYWHQPQMECIIASGTQVLIPPDSSRRKTARPGWKRGLYAVMRPALATDEGAELFLEGCGGRQASQYRRSGGRVPLSEPDRAGR